VVIPVGKPVSLCVVCVKTPHPPRPIFRRLDCGPLVPEKVKPNRCAPASGLSFASLCSWTNTSWIGSLDPDMPISSKSCCLLSWRILPSTLTVTKRLVTN
jgi:hypothetical protein